jgi:DNA-binding protein HU-beta
VIALQLEQRHINRGKGFYHFGARSSQGNSRGRNSKGHYAMNKSELVDAVSESANLSKADATRAVDAVIDSVTRALKRGDQVSLVGFGTFSVKNRAARTGRNPQTGQTIHIAASNVPGFKAGKALKDAVN